MLKLKYIFLIGFTAMMFGSCLKDTPYVDVSNTQPIIEFSYGSNGSTTLGNFGTNSSVEELDTAMGINIASPQVLDYPVTVTLKIDTSYIPKFNAKGGTQLEVLPDSTFRFDTTTITIAAGHRIGRIPITLYPSKIDPGISYGLPITIVSATGTGGQNLIVSGNAGVAFYSFIGNPLAGSYLQNFYRWNDVADTTGTPNSTTYEDKPITVIPLDPVTIPLPEGYLDANGLGYVALGFTNTSGVLTDPKVFIDDATQSNIDAVGFKTIDGPTLIDYKIVGDASTHYAGTYFRIYYEVHNSSGGDRKTVNLFTKQY